MNKVTIDPNLMIEVLATEVEEMNNDIDALRRNNQCLVDALQQGVDTFEGTSHGATRLLVEYERLINNAFTTVRP